MTISAADGATMDNANHLASFVREGLSGIVTTAVGVGVVLTSFIMRTAGAAPAHMEPAPVGEASVTISLSDLLGTVGTIGTAAGAAMTWWLTRRSQKASADIAVERDRREFEREQRQRDREERESAQRERLKTILMEIQVQHTRTSARVDQLAAGQKAADDAAAGPPPAEPDAAPAQPEPAS